MRKAWICLAFAFLLVCSDARKDRHRDDDDDDDDENDDAEESEEQRQSGEASEDDDRPAAAPKKTSVWRFPEQENFYMEIAILGFLVLYVVNFFRGKAANRAIAQAWWQENEPLFEKNFSRITHDDGVVMRQESNSVFTYYCTGRVSCRSMTITLNLRKRHDLLSMLFELISPSEDLVTLDVQMNETDMEPIVFAIVPRKREKAYRRDNADIAKYAAGAPNERLPSSLAVLSDSTEAVAAFLVPDVLQTVAAYERSLRALHVTDQAPWAPKNSKVLRLVCVVPPAHDMERTSVLFKMTMFLIDNVAKFKLSSVSRKKAETVRVDAEEEKRQREELQEAAQQRKLDRLRQEKAKFNEKLSKLKPEEQRQLEEKEHQRQLKEKQKKQKSVVVRA